MIPTLALDTSDGETQQNGGSATGSIIGGVVGGAAGLALIVAGIVLFKRRNRKQTISREQQQSQMYDDEFYADPYRQNEWSNGEFNMAGGGFPGTGEQVQRMNPQNTSNSLDEEENFYRSQQNKRKSWWSSVSTMFKK
ncbi:MAG: hypothetical protein JSY10_17880 [Paenibacillus sp.]|nr:hypothetical protein [Paenibacillus sp.]